MAYLHVNSFSLVLAIAAIVTTVGAARADFTYNDFSSVSGLQINGDAAQVGNVLRLTTTSPFQSGSAFTTASTPLGSLSSFSTYFQFRIENSGGISDEDGPGADGIVFVVQTVSNNVGGAGGEIGYGGINPSVGIEFDTYNNSEFGDPNGNHVGLDLGGNIVSSQTTTEPTRFNNGQIWNAWIDYDGTNKSLQTRWSLSNVRPSSAQLFATVDLPALVGSTAFLGFTAGTGSAWGDQDILHWEFRDSFNPITPAAPEPSTVALLIPGFLGLAFPMAATARHRRHTV